MANVHRALGAPWNIWGDQSDSLAQRDTGWLQFYCESCQVKLAVDHSKYCNDCMEDIADYLFEQAFDEMARDMKEKLAVERGLY